MNNTIRAFLVFSVCIHLGLAANIPKADPLEITASECVPRGGKCNEIRGGPVCGTDDKTYLSRCHLLQRQCSGHQVSLKYRGPCKACKDARDYALKRKTKHLPKFIPRCKEDGTYALIQCLGDSGCWCSDNYGKPIQNTSVRTGKPNCQEFNKINTRRSPTRRVRISRSRRTCSPIDRAVFNSNLIKVFLSEYIRSIQYHHDIKTGLTHTPDDSVVLDWKFLHLDLNRNHMLDKKEFQELKKLAKRVVKPRRCGRAFGKYCDVDNDAQLSRKEWNNCISKNVVNGSKQNITGDTTSGNTHHSGEHIYNGSNNRHSAVPNNNLHLNHFPNTIDSKNNINKHPLISNEKEEESASETEVNGQGFDYGDDGDYSPEKDGNDDNLGMSNTFSISANYPSIYFLRPKPDSSLKEPEVESDCLEDQAAALEEQRLGSTILYVPECTPDGRYQRVQCYRSTPYCWCVNEETGKNVPGTSVRDKRPQCDTSYTMTRSMKGCPEPRRSAFFSDLKDFLKIQILPNSTLGANTTKWISEDERIAMLSFVLIDKNKNKIWERREWKHFKELVTNSKILRKCGKKLPRYCDVNSDKKITLSEWLNCLQTQPEQTPTTPATIKSNNTATSRPLKLIGSNPLEQYLKD